MIAYNLIRFAFLFAGLCFCITTVTNLFFSIKQIPQEPVMCTYTGVREPVNGQLMYVHECMNGDTLVNMTSYASKCTTEGCISMLFKACPSSIAPDSFVFVDREYCTNDRVYLFNLFMMIGFILINCIALVLWAIYDEKNRNKQQEVPIPESLSFSNPLYNAPGKKDDECMYMDYEADFDLDSMGSGRTEADIGDEN